MLMVDISLNGLEKLVANREQCCRWDCESGNYEFDARSYLYEVEIPAIIVRLCVVQSSGYSRRKIKYLYFKWTHRSLTDHPCSCPISLSSIERVPTYVAFVESADITWNLRISTIPSWSAVVADSGLSCCYCHARFVVTSFGSGEFMK